MTACSRAHLTDDAITLAFGLYTSMDGTLVFGLDSSMDSAHVLGLGPLAFGLAADRLFGGAESRSFVRVGVRVEAPSIGGGVVVEVGVEVRGEEADGQQQQQGLSQLQGQWGDVWQLCCEIQQCRAQQLCCEIQQCRVQQLCCETRQCRVLQHHQMCCETQHWQCHVLHWQCHVHQQQQLCCETQHQLARKQQLCCHRVKQHQLCCEKLELFCCEQQQNPCAQVGVASGDASCRNDASRLDGFDGERIGEASHPGPALSQLHFDSMRQEQLVHSWELRGLGCVIAGLRRQIAALQSQLESDQLGWYLHMPACRCIVCVLQIELAMLREQLCGHGQLREAECGVWANDRHGVRYELPQPRSVHVLPKPRPMHVLPQPRPVVSQSTFGIPLPQPLSPDRVLPQPGSAPNEPESEFHDCHEYPEIAAVTVEFGIEVTDMLWTMFQEPRRKRGLRKSQKRASIRLALERELRSGPIKVRKREKRGM